MTPKAMTHFGTARKNSVILTNCNRAIFEFDEIEELGVHLE